jgi:CubicO group peptidase (beta-lactamase class C family)
MFEPGTNRAYDVRYLTPQQFIQLTTSQTGIGWAGIFTERLTGKSLGQYMQEHIFTPLNLPPPRLP